MMLQNLLKKIDRREINLLPDKDVLQAILPVVVVMLQIY